MAWVKDQATVSRISAYRSLLLAWVGFVPSAAAAHSDAIRVLLDQARYWSGLYQYDKADEALRRALAADPHNADALALEVQSAFDQGNQQMARLALAALQAAQPHDPRISMMLRALQSGPIDQAALAQARSFAADGKPEEAVASYRRIFRGDTPAPNLATEYYQTLAATDSGWEAGCAGLAELLRLNPQNLPAQLGYAELLTYHDETRLEGIQRLEVLVKIVSIADQANKDLRQALTWLPVSADNAPLFARYLVDHPGDTELRQRGQQAKNDTSNIRIDGFDAMQAGRFDEAEHDFSQALNINPRDSDSMVGLALVRLHQRRVDDARSLLRQAIDIDPTKADTYQSLVNSHGGSGSAGSTIDEGVVAARRIRAAYAQVAALTQGGRYADAERLLRGLMDRRPSLANLLQLADIQTHAGNLPEAETSYRSALAMQPQNAMALGGLASLLTREGNLAEADTLFAQAEASGGGARIGRMRAEALQQQAKKMSDPVARTGLLRAAVAADPSNPWLRLALARGLLAQDRKAEADQVMEAVAAASKPTVEQLQAGIYYYNETHNLQRAEALINRLPAEARTRDMQDIQMHAVLDAELRDARSQGSLDATRRRLLQAVSQPDPSGVRGSAIAAELVRLGDKPAAREAIRLAIVASHPVTPAQRLAYAGTLLGAGYPDDAKAVTAALQAARLSSAQARLLASLQDNTAVYAADNLNSAGKPAEAYDELVPRLAVNPNSPDLNMALSRIYETNQRSREALAINEALLRRNPDNLAVRRSAIGAALAAGESGRAHELADQTMAAFPDEPETWMAAADVARARNADSLALRDLKIARGLRQRQLATQSDHSAQAEPQQPQHGPHDALDTPSAIATDAKSSAWVPSAPSSALATRQDAQYVPAPPPASTVAVVAQVTSLGLPPSNPFRESTSSAALTFDEPPAVPGIQSRLARPQPADALMQDIDRSIAAVSEDVAPRLEASLGLRGRSGDDGLGRLLEVMAPVEASYSPNDYGRLTVQVTPTYLYSGKPSMASAGLFGTNPLAGTSVSPMAASVPRSQTAGGVALDVKYAYDIVTADVGSTPVGFQQQNVVGGIGLQTRIADNFVLHLNFDRRAVEDSLLSFAGTRDARSGQKFGGVTLNRLQAKLDGSIGRGYVYANIGAGYLFGENVERNSEVNAGVGFSYPIYQDATREVRVGSDFTYYNYNKNLGGFTVGQGGYFSPQKYFAALFPINYRQRVSSDLVFNIGGSIGFQTFNQKSSPIFPNNAALQSQLIQVSWISSGVATIDQGGHFAGIAGGAHADVDYRLTPHFHIGTSAGFDRTGDFTEGTGLVYARYVFNDVQ